jgi:uncharacterized membrane protein
MNQKTAKAQVDPIRQRTQYTCMATSMSMCLRALDIDTDEDTVNDVMGAQPMKGAAWEQALACAQHYGVRATLTMPSTIRQLKGWTDQGIPVMIAWNPEKRDWSHASVVYHVEEGPIDSVPEDHVIQGSGPGLYVWVADPNIPHPEKTTRVVHEDVFYGSWAEKFPRYFVRRPALALEREVTRDGRQVMAKSKKKKKPLSQKDRMKIDKTPPKPRNKAMEEHIKRGPSGAGTHHTREQDVDRGSSRKDKHKKNWSEKDGMLTQSLQSLPDYGIYSITSQEMKSLLDELGPNRSADMSFPQLSADSMGRLLTAKQSEEKESEDKEGKFEKGTPADPTQNMTDEQKAEWEKQKEENKDNFKSARVSEELLSDLEDRFSVLEGMAEDLVGGRTWGNPDPHSTPDDSVPYRHHDELPAAGEDGSTQRKEYNKQYRKLVCPGNHKNQCGMTPAQLDYAQRQASASMAELEVAAEELLAGRSWGDPHGKGYKSTPVDDKIPYNRHDDAPPAGCNKDGGPPGCEGSYADRLKYNQWFRKNVCPAHGTTCGNPGLKSAFERVSRVAFTTGVQTRFASLEETLKGLSAGVIPQHSITTKSATTGHSGLYGYTKKTQNDCESSIRKLSRTAARLAKIAWTKDPKTAEFLTLHSKRANSIPARMLIAAMKGLGPKVAKEARLAELRAQQTPKTAAKNDPRYGLYGYSTKTARLGLNACSMLREAAGHVASDLHGRRANGHEVITGFFKNHHKTSKCGFSRMLLAGYPDASMKLASEAPAGVQEWIEWED